MQRDHGTGRASARGPPARARVGRASSPMARDRCGAVFPAGAVDVMRRARGDDVRGASSRGMRAAGSTRRSGNPGASSPDSPRFVPQDLFSASTQRLYALTTAAVRPSGSAMTVAVATVATNAASNPYSIRSSPRSSAKNRTIMVYVMGAFSSGDWRVVIALRAAWRAAEAIAAPAVFRKLTGVSLGRTRDAPTDAGKTAAAGAVAPAAVQHDVLENDGVLGVFSIARSTPPRARCNAPRG